MQCKNALPGLLLGVLAAMMVVIGLGNTPAMANALDLYNLESQWFGGSSTLVIPAAAFSSDGGFPDDFFFDFDNGYVQGDNFACLKAPVYLPDGAKVTSVTASLYDNAPVDFGVDLRRVNVVTGTVDVMASIMTTRNSTSIQQRSDTTISYPEVSYPAYAYFLTTCLNSPSHRLYAVIINTENKIYLPVVYRD
ncbi:hypothetical protein AMJ86_06995 [bacterium SM23_57]|nr:MAG: hypothetical protein AMJ86_06995 [bacterium SM23_57]